MSSVSVKNKLHNTGIDLKESLRGELVHLLNNALSNLIDLKLRFKQAHWNVRGMNFLELHNLFDEVAGEVEEFVDMIAERTTALGGTALGTLQSVAHESKLTSYPTDISEGKDHLTVLSKNLAVVCKVVRESIHLADELEDADTADLFTEISRTLDKRLWFLEAHIK